MRREQTASFYSKIGMIDCRIHSQLYTNGIGKREFSINQKHARGYVNEPWRVFGYAVLILNGMIAIL
jgi:hypothetical protein